MTESASYMTFGLVLLNALCGGIAARNAPNKDRDLTFWFLAGLGLGPLGLIWQMLVGDRRQLRHPERRRWYEHTPVRYAARFLVSLPLLAAVYGIGLWLANDPLQPFLPVAGLFIVAWGFVAALTLARFGLRFGSGPMGVARTVFDEALRMKLALVFIVLLVLVLPIIPFVLGSDEPLRYRVQSFLTYSFYATAVLLGLMTIFLACRTLSQEIEQKQIFTLAVKPISRTGFLFGKWFGIVVLNGVLLGTAALAIYCCTTLYLAHLPAQDAADRQALHERVLVARVTSMPRPAVALNERVQQRLERMKNQNRQEILSLGKTEADRRGLGTAGNTEKLMELGLEQAEQQIRKQIGQQWLSIGPGQQKTYVFTGLENPRAKAADFERQRQANNNAGRGQPNAAPSGPEPTVQLHYHVVASGSGLRKIPMGVEINDRRRVLEMPTDTAQVVEIPARFIDQDGVLRVTFQNPPNRDYTVRFETDGGLEVLYAAGNFGPNFLRAVLVIWIKLAFLAMVGLAAATFLGFPVACLLALLVAIIAPSSPFLLEALGLFGGGQPNAAQQVIKWIGLGLAKLLEQYSRFEPLPMIVDGRLFTWNQVLQCLAWIGGAWTLIVGIIAAVIFRNRELARVQV